MPHAFLCDFDGTISPDDVGAALVERFATGDPAERDALLERWIAGAIGHRAITEAQCRLLSVTEAEALEFVRGFEIDPGFVPFARESIARGDEVMVVSEGFEFYVAELLARAGAPDLPRAANRAVFEEGRMRAEFPFADPACGACGNCKGQHARRYRSRGYRVVMVGDGLSDRCGARAADTVVARGDLEVWCRREGLPALPFEGFASLAGIVRRLDDLAPARPAAQGR